MKTYGVVFNDNDKVYYYNSDLELKDKDIVVVPTEKTTNTAIVVRIFKKLKEKENIKTIIRKATKKDIKQIEQNKEDAINALKEAKKQAKHFNLKMNILSASYSFDRKQLQFNFTSDERIDFRELAKALAGIYKVRIELRQIGVRDKAKNIGGIGQCGRCLCCSTFLNKVGSISINTVKNQNIAINPAKINGQCGRLFCCLTYEDEEYTRCQKNMPKVGDIVKTEYGEGKVVSVDILNRMYKIDIDGIKKEIKVNCENCSK